jgi:hypothetical protein
MKSQLKRNSVLLAAITVCLLGGVLPDTAWAQVGDVPIVAESAKLVPSDPEDGFAFGYTAAISGKDVLVGSPYWGSPSDVESGSVYHFTRDAESTWSEVAKIASPDPDEVKSFGDRVAIDGVFAVIGGGSQKSAYIFENTGPGGWVERAKLIGDSADAGNFGEAVAIYGDTAVVGGSDRVYVFTRDGNGWPLTQILDAGAVRPQFFGADVTIHDDVIAVRAGPVPDSGLCFLAYVYRKTASGLWSLSDRLTSTSALPDCDALSLDTDGQMIILGDSADPTMGRDAGAAYIYRREGIDSWVEEAKLLPPYDGTEPPPQDFGWLVAIEGGIAIICEDESMRLPFSGVAFVYRRDHQREWKPIAMLYPSDPVRWVYFCADDLDFEDDTVIVAASSLGGAYVYEIGALLGELEISIDIKPGNKRNVINPRSFGRFWIAILSADEFDALRVDPQSVRLGAGGASPDKYRVRDSNHDGVADLLVRFRTPEVGIACGDTSLEIVGQTYDGVDIVGEGDLKTVGCKKPKPKKKRKNK